MEDWDRRPSPIDARANGSSRRSFRKMLLVTAVVFVGSCAFVVAAIIWLATRHPEARDAGRRYGRGVSQVACFPEALRRLEHCQSLTCAYGEGAFLGECLNYAEPSPALCTGVPPSVIGDEAVQWATLHCRRIDAPMSYCVSLFGSFITECNSRRAATSPAA